MTFDEGWDKLQGTKGIWVRNEGVSIVSTGCIHNNCGYFDGQSFLSIPYFKGNYQKNGFSVSFFFKSQSGTPANAPLALISNDCSPSDYAGSAAAGKGSLSIKHFHGSVLTVMEQEQAQIASLSATVSMMVSRSIHSLLCKTFILSMLVHL